MPYLTQLAAVARRTGFPVTEVSGWQTRGHGPQPAVQGIVCHHTAGPAAGGDYPSLTVVRSGRTGLAGPLSHFGLGRSGRIYVIAAGRCWHNAPSTSANHTNSASIGIEAENNGFQPWPTVQLAAYKALVAELCREFRLHAGQVKGHKEVNTQKPDPHSINMNDFRTAVARLIAGEDDDVSAEDVWTGRIKVPYASPDKPEWQAATVLTNHGVWLRKVSGQVDALSAQVQAQNATIKALADALAARDGAVDVDALIRRIRSEIETVTVRLDVVPEASPPA